MKPIPIIALFLLSAAECVGPKNCLGAAISQNIVITVPGNATVIKPHHLLKVEVSANKSDFPGGVVIASAGIQTPVKTDPPYEFILLMPSILGPRKLTAFGIVAPGKSALSKAVTIDVEKGSSARNSGAEDLGTLREQSTEQLQTLAFDRTQEQSVRVGAILHLKSRNPPGMQEKLQQCLAADQPSLVRMAAEKVLGLPEK